MALGNLTPAVSPLAAKIIYPLRTATTLHTHSPEWLSNVSRDRGLLYITAFAIESFIDRVLRRDFDTKSLTATMHYRRGVKLLREQIQTGAASDYTMAAVVKLAGAALFDGDEVAVRRHMHCLCGMVGIRGGIDSLSGEIQVDMLRYGTLRFNRR